MLICVILYYDIEEHAAIQAQPKKFMDIYFREYRIEQSALSSEKMWGKMKHCQ